MASGADLLEKMRRSPHGYGQAHFERLFKHYGFKKSEQTRHTVYRHELLDPGDVVLVPRHRKVKGYITRKAVAAVDLVLARREELANGEQDG